MILFIAHCTMLICFNPLQVQTKHTILKRMNTIMFQSFNPPQVQTKLEEHEATIAVAELLEFQSPIGTNKTWGSYVWSGVIWRSFNPLQVQTKRIMKLNFLSILMGFNLLQVQTKPLELQVRPQTLISFNPLQVQTKLIVPNTLSNADI